MNGVPPDDPAHAALAHLTEHGFGDGRPAGDQDHDPLLTHIERSQNVELQNKAREAVNAAIGADLSGVPDTTYDVIVSYVADAGSPGVLVAAGVLSSYATGWLQHSCHRTGRVNVALQTDDQPDPGMREITDLASDLLTATMTGNGQLMFAAVSRLAVIDDPAAVLVTLTKVIIGQIRAASQMRSDAYAAYDRWTVARVAHEHEPHPGESHT